MDRPTQLTRFLHLTETILPARARELGWPIRLDHCFKRICLDHAFGGVWNQHIARPAYRHLTGAPLERALECAEALSRDDGGLLAQRNQQSLAWRGKLQLTDDH